MIRMLQINILYGRNGPMIGPLISFHKVTFLKSWNNQPWTRRVQANREMVGSMTHMC